jgi:hypothetical protein
MAGQWEGRARRKHTALKRRLLSTGALCLLSAHAGAVVASAANHFGCCGSWLVELNVYSLICEIEYAM